MRLTGKEKEKEREEEKDEESERGRERSVYVVCLFDGSQWKERMVVAHWKRGARWRAPKAIPATGNCWCA